MLRRKFSTLCLLWIIITLCLPLTCPAHASDSCPISIPTSPGNAIHNTCVGGKITWDDTNSAATIERNKGCAVAITDEQGKGGPYYWSVSGNGFRFEVSKTDTTNNTLLANGTACGTATVKVTDCGGKTATGYVRCTTGAWALTQAKGSDCPWSGTKAPDYAAGGSDAQIFGYKTYGKWNVSVMYIRCNTKDAAGVACRSAWGLYDPLGGLEPAMANFIASGPCCGSFCNECISFTYFTDRKPWPGVTAMDRYGIYPLETASAALEGHAYIISSYPDKCNQSYPYYSVSARLSFWKAYIDIYEWGCP